MIILAAIKDWFDWFPGESVAGGLKWTLVIVLIVVGFLGTFLPVRNPGDIVSYRGAEKAGLGQGETVYDLGAALASRDGLTITLLPTETRARSGAPR